MDDEKFYYCKSCSSEFDPFAEDVKVLHESHGVIIIQDRSGRAHSLTLTSWNKIKRVRELEDHARPINPVNLYQEPDNASESEQEQGSAEADGTDAQTDAPEVWGENTSEGHDGSPEETIFSGGE